MSEKKSLKTFFKKKIKTVFHLAAQAGVRDSLKIPKSYFKSNFDGFLILLNYQKNIMLRDLFLHPQVRCMETKKFPLKERINIIPKNIYAATKKINEEIGRDISLISKMSIIGLRFFTVYGTHGRPDMFIFKYLKSQICDKKFELYNHGKNFRDYTHVDDVVKIIDKLRIKKLRKKFDIFNICSSKPIDIYKLSSFYFKKSQ